MMHLQILHSCWLRIQQNQGIIAFGLIDYGDHSDPDLEGLLKAHTMPTPNDGALGFVAPYKARKQLNQGFLHCLWL